jgi:hypothetical protein
MFTLLPNFLQEAAVSFGTDLCQLFIDIFWRRQGTGKRTEAQKKKKLR